tara:strand:+ start:58 stop:312 length:255 start_codon:yes stop_codon:yes gene_type:complete
MDEVDAIYDHLLGDEAMDRILTVMWSNDVGAVSVEFEPGFLRPETLEQRKRHAEILVSTMWTIERALLMMDGQILRSEDDDVVH